MLLLISSRQKHSLISVRRLFAAASTFPFPSPSAKNTHSTSKLRTEYSFIAPPSFLPQNPNNPQSPTNNSSLKRKSKPAYKPPSSLETGKKPLRSDLPFDFRYSYTESDPAVKTIGLREPKYSPFGPGRVDREWTGVCAPAVDPKVRSVDGEMEDPKSLEEKRKELWNNVQGDTLTDAEKKILVDSCQRHRTRKQINIGRDGLTHNMLDDIHNHWKHAEAIRIKCMGVSTVDMKKVCAQLQDKTFGKIIERHGGFVVLYRGRNYHPKKRPVVPLMLWKPQEPIYPKLIKTTIDGLSIEETKTIRKRGLNVPALTKLARNGYCGNLVAMVRDSFLTEEMVRIDCHGLDRSDHKKIGVKLRDLVPCTLVSFEKEQIVVWRGANSKSREDVDYSLMIGSCLITQMISFGVQIWIEVISQVFFPSLSSN